MHSFRYAVIAVTIATLSRQALALDPPFGATLVGQWDGFTTGLYADVYGDGNYAYICHFGHHVVDIIDISNPAAPIKVSEIVPPPPNDTASAQQVTVKNGMAFVALESNDNDGLLIVDVRNPLAPVIRTRVTVLPNFDDVHNMHFHDGLLYLANSRTPHIAVVDLRTYNMDAAPATITTALTEFTYGTSFVHDINVAYYPSRNQSLLLACGWNSGVGVYDVTNIATTGQVFLGSAPGSATHSAWATPDAKFVVTGEERGGGGIKCFEILDAGGGLVSLVQRDSHVLPSSSAYSVHNQMAVGYRLYNSWYQGGLQVFDINPVSGELDLVASYDTYDGSVIGFDGNWGVYPFLGPDKVLLSDMQTGLYIVDVSGDASIVLPNGLPANVHSVDPTPVTVKVLDPGVGVVPSSVTLHYTVTGELPQDVVMTAQGNDLYTANLPPTPCALEVSFYFTAETVVPSTISNPTTAPVQQYTLLPQTNSIELFRNNLNSSTGWVVGAPGDNATAGIWVHGDPVGTSAQPEDDNPNSTGTNCFFTGQGAVGGALGAADVDNGTTTLTSPSFSGLLYDQVSVGYARWYSNNQGGSPNADQMNVLISNDNGSNWTTLEVVTENVGDWVEKHFVVEDVIAPTGTMKLRFVASDLGSGSIVEAAVDDLVLAAYLCNEPFGDSDGDGDVDLVDYSDIDNCLTGPQVPQLTGCSRFDTDLDNDVDMIDYLTIHLAFTGSL